MENRILLNPIGGLANRMRAILSGRSLARAAGKPLHVIWHPDRGCSITPDKLFATEHFDFRLGVPSKIDYFFRYELPRKRNLYLSRIYQSGMRTYIDGIHGFCSDAFDDESFMNIIKSDKRDTYLASGTEFYPFDHDDYAAIFKPRPEIERMALELTGPDTSDMVGVHIRRTDNLQSIRNSPLGLFTARMERAIAERPDTIFFLATDDEDTKALMKRQFGERRIITRNNKAARDTESGMKEAWADMLALANTRLILGSYYSSFSEAASFLGNTPLEILKAD